jgi:hypothetical protein
MYELPMFTDVHSTYKTYISDTEKFVLMTSHPVLVSSGPDSIGYRAPQQYRTNPNFYLYLKHSAFFNIIISCINGILSVKKLSSTDKLQKKHVLQISPAGDPKQCSFSPSASRSQVCYYSTWLCNLG